MFRVEVEGVGATGRKTDRKTDRQTDMPDLHRLSPVLLRTTAHATAASVGNYLEPCSIRCQDAILSEARPRLLMYS